MKDIQTRITDAQTALQNKKLKGGKREQAEEVLKRMTQQMFSAQHELESCEAKAAQLMKNKADLANRLEAKKKSAEKFRNHELWLSLSSLECNW